MTNINCFLRDKSLCKIWGVFGEADGNGLSLALPLSTGEAGVWGAQKSGEKPLHGWQWSFNREWSGGRPESWLRISRCSSRALHAFRAWLPSLQLTGRQTSDNTLNSVGKKCPRKRSRNPEKQGYVTSSQIIWVAASPEVGGGKAFPMTLTIIFIPCLQATLQSLMLRLMVSN